MSPRILDVKQCPHCKERLGTPAPRVCPACGGSLQKRYLSLGCLSTAPLFLALAALAARGLGAGNATQHAGGRATPAATSSFTASTTKAGSCALDAVPRVEAVAIAPRCP